ncbi:MAG: hypothetical protein Q8932_07790 [Bacteroidota bacterium]|nr:hypothetical protein [Bacteroidota bacterium]
MGANHVMPWLALAPGAFALVAMGAVFGAASRATFPPRVISGSPERPLLLPSPNTPYRESGSFPGKQDSGHRISALLGSGCPRP